MKEIIIYVTMSFLWISNIWLLSKNWFKLVQIVLSVITDYLVLLFCCDNSHWDYSWPEITELNLAVRIWHYSNITKPFWYAINFSVKNVKCCSVTQIVALKIHVYVQELIC